MPLKFVKKPEPEAEETPKPAVVFKAKKPKATKSAAPEAVDPALDAAQVALIEKMINKRGLLMNEEKALKTRLGEIAAQKAEMEELLLSHPALAELDLDETLPLETDEFVATIGKMGQSRFVTEEGKNSLLEMLGAEKFVELANFGITDLDNYLTLDQRNKVMSSKATKRSITIKPRMS